MSPIAKELRQAAKCAPLWKTIFESAADEIERLQGVSKSEHIELNPAIEKPEEGRLVWIITYQGHINVAYYSKLLGGGFHNCGDQFVDKHGDCDVKEWCYADVPDFNDEG